jgi:hypothetical protein
MFPYHKKGSAYALYLLFKTGQLSDPWVFSCPSTDDVPFVDHENERIVNCSYCYFNNHVKNPPGRNICMLADKKGNHKTGGHLIFLDGHGRFIKDTNYSPEKYLGRTDEEITQMLK